MEQYCIYLRKSRKDIEAEAHGEGETLARHESILLSYAHKHNLNILKIHREIVSGETIQARPVMQQLLQEVSACLWDGVLVIELERLARGDTSDQGLIEKTFKFSNTKIITPTKTYDPNNEFDEEYFEFGLFMSRREYKTINRRLQRGRIASVNEGKYVGNRPPYGYTRIKIKRDKGYTLTPHPEQAPVVRQIFSWYADGLPDENGAVERLGICRIAEKLDSLHIQPQKGNTWSISSIRDILQNPTYVGKLRWNWRAQQKRMESGQIVRSRPRADDYVLVDGLHPAIISQDLFDRVQQLMSANNRPNPIARERSIQNPLAGLVVCQKCGHKMIRKVGSPYDMLMCQHRTCDNISAPLPLVEQAVLHSLEDWLSGYRLSNQENFTSSPENASLLVHVLESVQKELGILKIQLDNTYDLLEQGIYSKDMFLERNRNLAERIGSLQTEEKRLQNEIKEEKERRIARQEVIPNIETVLELYSSSDIRTKNNLLRQVIEKIEYLKVQKNTRGHKDVVNFELHLYPKLPKKL